MQQPLATYKDSQRQERSLAKQLGGSVNAGSGNGWVRKGDVRSEHELWECKITSAKSYPMKIEELEKLENQAIVDGRIPVFLVEFLKSGGEYVILSKNDYLEMRETYFGNETTNRVADVVQ